MVRNYYYDEEESTLNEHISTKYQFGSFFPRFKQFLLRICHVVESFLVSRIHPHKTIIFE